METLVRFDLLENGNYEIVIFYKWDDPNDVDYEEKVIGVIYENDDDGNWVVELKGVTTQGFVSPEHAQSFAKYRRDF